MPATLTVAHTAIGVEVRRRTYDVVVDGTHAGSVELNGTLEMPVEPGCLHSARRTAAVSTFAAGIVRR